MYNHLKLKEYVLNHINRSIAKIYCMTKISDN